MPYPSVRYVDLQHLNEISQNTITGITVTNYSRANITDEK